MGNGVKPKSQDASRKPRFAKISPGVSITVITRESANGPDAPRWTVRGPTWLQFRRTGAVDLTGELGYHLPCEIGPGRRAAAVRKFPDHSRVRLQ
jgi:hypothetical protein